jgi:uncharacterized protein (DUF1015 family)
VYDKAKQNLDAFISRNVLFSESKACYYIYQLVMNGRSQTGLVCCSSVDDYDNNLIKKHEFTRPEKELDRINHIKTTLAQTGNVFMAYRKVNEIDEIIEKWKKERGAVYDFVADDKVKHTIWLISDEKVIAKIANLFKEKVPATYIADGHHRVASAANLRMYMGSDTSSANYFLTTLFPSDQLHILDYNRLIKDLNGNSPEEFLQKLSNDFEIEKIDKPHSPSTSKVFGMYLQHQWYKLSLKDAYTPDDPVQSLDISIFEERITKPLLGIEDQRTDKRLDFVGGIRGLDELVKRVDSGEMTVAFSFYPVSIDQLFSVADSCNVMPPKSTWFEPKLRDGLLTHLLI